jgi:hypothetical protein
VVQVLHDRAEARRGGAAGLAAFISFLFGNGARPASQSHHSSMLSYTTHSPLYSSVSIRQSRSLGVVLQYALLIILLLL